MARLGLDLAKSGAGESAGHVACGAGNLELELGHPPAGFALEKPWVAVAEVAGLGFRDDWGRYGARALLQVAVGDGLLEEIDNIRSLVESLLLSTLEGDFAIDEFFEEVGQAGRIRDAAPPGSSIEFGTTDGRLADEDEDVGIGDGGVVRRAAGREQQQWDCEQAGPWEGPIHFAADIAVGAARDQGG